jgi:hypothetical protein
VLLKHKHDNLIRDIGLPSAFSMAIGNIKGMRRIGVDQNLGPVAGRLRRHSDASPDEINFGGKLQRFERIVFLETIGLLSNTALIWYDGLDVKALV